MGAAVTPHVSARPWCVWVPRVRGARRGPGGPRFPRLTAALPFSSSPREHLPRALRERLLACRARERYFCTGRARVGAHSDISAPAARFRRAVAARPGPGQRRAGRALAAAEQPSLLPAPDHRSLPVASGPRRWLGAASSTGSRKITNPSARFGGAASRAVGP